MPDGHPLGRRGRNSRRPLESVPVEHTLHDDQGDARMLPLSQRQLLLLPDWQQSGKFPPARSEACIPIAAANATLWGRMSESVAPSRQSARSSGPIRPDFRGNEQGLSSAVPRNHPVDARPVLWSAAGRQHGPSMNRPGNGQDLPLPIDLAHLPDLEARMVNLVVDDKIIVKRHQPQGTVMADLDVAKSLF